MNSSKAVHTREEIAKVAGVSESSVQKMKAIMDSTSENLKQEVLAGEQSINAAYKKVSKPSSKKARKRVSSSKLYAPATRETFKKQFEDFSAMIKKDSNRISFVHLRDLWESLKPFIAKFAEAL